MKKAKLFLLGGIFTLVGIFNFSSAQFFEDLYGNCPVGLTSQLCSLDNFNSIKFSGTGVYKVGVSVKTSPSSSTFLYFGQGSDCKCNGTSSFYNCKKLTSINKDDIYNLVIENGYSVSQILGFYINKNTCSEFSVNYNTSTMPVSELTPVITGLTNSMNEFIPYVVYVGLGVLGVIFGFFAFKRLLRYVKGSSLSVFRSRRKRK